MWSGYKRGRRLNENRHTKKIEQSLLVSHLVEPSKVKTVLSVVDAQYVNAHVFFHKVLRSVGRKTKLPPT